MSHLPLNAFEYVQVHCSRAYSTRAASSLHPPQRIARNWWDAVRCSALPDKRRTPSCAPWSVQSFVALHPDRFTSPSTAPVWAPLAKIRSASLHGFTVAPNTTSRVRAPRIAADKRTTILQHIFCGYINVELVELLRTAGGAGVVQAPFFRCDATRHWRDFPAAITATGDERNARFRVSKVI